MSPSDRPSVWLVNPYGPLPGEQWREYRSATFGTILARAGYSVTWWTAGFSHHFKVHRSREAKEIFVAPNFRVCLVPTPGYRKHVGLARFGFELAFAWRLNRATSGSQPPAFIISPDAPQSSALAAARLARRHGAKFIIDVMDLWPELFNVALPSMLRPAGPALFWPFRALRRFVRGQADAVTALCPSYLRHALAEARRGIQSRVIYNGIDVEGFRASALDRRNEVAELMGRSKAPGELWAVFAGTIGNNYDIACLVAAATRLKDDEPPIRIWIAGDGPLRSHVTDAIQRGVDRLHFLGKLDHTALAALYAYCDVGLCAYSTDSNVGMPDKAYDYMAAGLPIVSSLKGDLNELIKTEQIGLHYQAGNTESLVSSLRSLAQQALRKRLSANSFARALAFDRTAQYHRMLELLEELNREGTVGPHGVDRHDAAVV